MSLLQVWCDDVGLIVSRGGIRAEIAMDRREESREEIVFAERERVNWLIE